MRHRPLRRMLTLATAMSLGSLVVFGGFAETAWPSERAAAWDPLVSLSDQPGFFSGPVYDAAGNAWALLYDTRLSVVRSDGGTGSWQPPRTLLESTAELIWPQIAVDLAGNASVVYGWQNGFGWQVHAFHYASATGWRGPELVYSSEHGFTRISLATDASNNLVVVFNRDSSAIEPQAWSIVYSRAAGEWGPARRISPPGHTALMQTVAQNKAGSAIMLAYLLQGRARRSIVSHVFDASSLWWQAPVTLPAPANLASYSVAFAGDRYPFTVDAAGSATLLTPVELRSYDAIYGFRYEAGSWAAGVEVLSTVGFQDILGFGDADVNDAGEVLGVMTNIAPGESAQKLLIFRFTPGQGWTTETAAELTTTTLYHCRVAWLGSSGQAVATYVDSTLRSVIYAGDGWSALDIPGAPLSLFHETATAPTGEVVLLFDGSYASPPTGTVATWLRP